MDQSIVQSVWLVGWPNVYQIWRSNVKLDKKLNLNFHRFTKEDILRDECVTAVRKTGLRGL